jgi:hypothetical protein
MSEAASAAMDRTSAVVRQIEKHAPVTMEGILVKVRALRWTYGQIDATDEESLDSIMGMPWHRHAPSTDARLARGILGDLNRIAAAQEVV